MKIKKGWGRFPIKKMVPADWNYKEDDEEKAENLRNNIKRIGQVENILIRELDTGFLEVINGNHRLPVFKELKINKPVCFNFGKISLAAAQRIAVETNETKFDSNANSLAAIIKEISAEFEIEELSTTMPYTQDELSSMIKLHDFDWDQYSDDGEDEEDEEDENEEEDHIITCPECGHKFIEE